MLETDALFLTKTRAPQSGVAYYLLFITFSAVACVRFDSLFLLFQWYFEPTLYNMKHSYVCRDIQLSTWRCLGVNFNCIMSFLSGGSLLE